MQVRLYANLRQIAGTREVEIPVEGQQAVGDVLHALVERYPRLSEAIWNADGSLAGHVAVVLNGRDVRHLARVDTPLSDDDSLALFPPVVGGSDGDAASGTCDGRKCTSVLENMPENTLSDMITVLKS